VSTIDADRAGAGLALQQKGSIADAVREGAGTACPEHPRAHGPPMETEIVGVVAPAKAAVQISPEGAGFLPFGKLRAGLWRERPAWADS
jgi:hypothetical protein